MKRIVSCLICFFAIFMLASCGNKQTFKFEITDKTELRTSVVFEYSFSDPDKQLANSQLKYSISIEGQDGEEKSGTITQQDSGSITVSSLKEGTSYLLDVTTSFDNKAVTVISGYKFATSAKGMDEDHPYEISEASSFVKMLQNDYTGYFKLTADIDLEGIEVNPLFSSKSTYFAGTFDGDGHKITNFNLGTPADEEAGTTATNHTYSVTYTGLFGGISDSGVVKNLTIENANLYVYRSSSTYFSFVAGYNAGKIENVHVKDSVLYAKGSSATHYAGGIAGQNFVAGVIENCSVENCTIEVKNGLGAIVGGICGANDTTETSATTPNKIKNCSFSGNINVNITTSSTLTANLNVKVGGIIGFNNSYVGNTTVDANIKVSTDDANYSGTVFNVYVGGAVGHNLKDGSSVIYHTDVTASFDLDVKDAKVVSLGLIAGYNGGTKETSSAQIIGATFTNKGENVVSAKEGLTSIGAVGTNKNNQTDIQLAEDVTVTLNEYENRSSEEAKKITVYTISNTGVETNVTYEAPAALPE